MQQLENNTAPERGWDDDFYPILRQSMRLWIALQMVIIVPLAVLIVAGYEVSWFHFVPPAFGLVLGLLVIFPWIQQRLGKAFSGVLIAALTFTPQIASYAIVTFDAELPAQIISFISASRGLPLMFAGVIIAVWCYGFRAVLRHSILIC